MNDVDAVIWRRTIQSLIMDAIPVAVPLDDRRLRLVGTRFVVVIREESPREHEGWSLARRGET